MNAIMQFVITLAQRPRSLPHMALLWGIFFSLNCLVALASGYLTHTFIGKLQLGSIQNGWLQRRDILDNNENLKNCDDSDEYCHAKCS